MGKGFDLFQRIAAELFADHFQFVIQTGDADGDLGVAFLHERDQTQARGLGVAVLDQRHGGRCGQACHVIRGQAQIMRAQDFTLVHRDAALDLAQVFAHTDLQDQLFHLAELAIFSQGRRPFVHLV